MKILEEYKPLFFEDYFICDLWGGRGRGGSHQWSTHALYELIYNKDLRGFFVRQTSSTIYSSMWQDLKDRIKEFEELHNHDLSYLKVSDNRQGANFAENTLTGGTIKTAGFQTSSGQNTAQMKSLAGATNLWIEELEEVDYSHYLKLEQSFRKKGVKIKIVRAFNPPPKEHWIWKDYEFKTLTEDELINEIVILSKETKDKIKDLVNRNRLVQGQPMDNVYLKADAKGYKHISIFTNYGYNRKNLSDVAIKKYEDLKYKDFHLYCRTFLGLITSGTERAVLTGATKITKEQFLEAEGNLLYGLDFGDTAPNALSLHKIDDDNKKWYTIELLYIPDRTEPLIQALERLGISKAIPIIPDPAGKTQIQELRKAGYLVRAISKTHDANVNAIKQLRQYDLYFCGENLWSEYLGWKYAENKTGVMLEDEVPMKGNDHLMDNLKYSYIGKRHAVNNFKLEL